jgi:starvation-inducible DNA-binding protein
MHASPSALNVTSRASLAETLNARLADALDLHSAVKLAHWNLRGPQFPALHAFFDQLAGQVAELSDDLAERAVTLGGVALGGVRQAAKASRLAPYPLDARRDLEHVRLIAERIDAALVGLRESRHLVVELRDDDTADLLTGAVRALEKTGWFLRATAGE